MKVFRDLVNLNANRARVAILDRKIPELKALAAELQNDVSISIACYGDPTGSIRAIGSHSDPTQRRAMKDVPEDVRQLIEDIRSMTIERHRTAARIELAEQALAFLNKRERTIVELRICDGMSWFDVQGALEDRNGDVLNEKTVRSTYIRACLKIEPFFSADAEGVSDGKRFCFRSKPKS